MAKKPAPEDAFYDHLTMGLIKTLANVPRIVDVCCEKRQPCEKSQVSNWEQRHCVYLPEDMKKFYLSTDGFILHWSYEYSANDIRRIGYIHFPHLLQITLLRENVESSTNIPTPAANASASPSTDQLGALPSHPTPSKDKWGNPTPNITPKAKIFEMNNINDAAKVCLVYESTGTSFPKFYLLELESFRWQFLADTFTEYLRMAIAHLGLPFWELCFSTTGLPSWTELFMLMAPHLLDEQEPRRTKYINPADEHPHATLDLNIFRSKSNKPSSKSTTGRK